MAILQGMETSSGPAIPLPTARATLRGEEEVEAGQGAGSAPAWLLAGYSQPTVFLLPSVLPSTNSYRAALGHGVVALNSASPWSCHIPVALHPPPLLSPFRSFRGFKAGVSSPLWEIAAALPHNQPRSQHIAVSPVPCSHHSGVAAPTTPHVCAVLGVPVAANRDRCGNPAGGLLLGSLL